MTIAAKSIVDSYSKLFEGLDSFTKLELIERLSKSLRKETNSKDKDFFKSFGSFPDDRAAEEIIEDIKASRNFREKDLSLHTIN